MNESSPQSQSCVSGASARRRRALPPRGVADFCASGRELLRRTASSPLVQRLAPRSKRIARIAWLDSSSGDSEMTVAGRSKRARASRERLGAEGALAVGKVLRLVPVRVRDVREVDVERRAGLEHAVGLRERVGEGLDLDVRAVRDGVQVGEVEHRSHPVDALGDPDDVVEASEVAHAAHHLDAEGHATALAFEPLPQRPELIGDRFERGLALAAEQEAGVEDDELGAAGDRDSGGMVEHAGGHVVLPVTLEVAHEPGDRRVHRERDVRFAGELAEALRPGIVHPELALEVDFTGRVAALLEQLHGRLGALAGGHARRADAGQRHASPA